jgi:uncharacterized protein
VYVWNEAKRESNLEKHGLDFVDAWMVYENPEKYTVESSLPEERRWLDLALVEVKGRVLVLVYTERDKNIRVISFRYANRKEREFYEQARKENEK